MQYFGSNIVEGVAGSWVEAEMSWVEVDGAGWRWMEVDGAGWRWVHGLVIPIENCSCVDSIDLFGTEKDLFKCHT